MKNWQTELGRMGMLVGTLGLLHYLGNPRSSWVQLIPMLLITVGGVVLYIRGRR